MSNSRTPAEASGAVGTAATITASSRAGGDGNRRDSFKLTSIFSKEEGHEGGDEEFYRFRTLLRMRREKYHRMFGLAAYLPFIILFILHLTMSRNIASSYDFYSGISDILVDEEFKGPKIYKSFHSVQSIEEFWEWMDVFLDAIANPKDPKIYRYNEVVGGVRLRQLRVDSKPCDGPSVSMPSPKTECYGDYSIFANEDSPYGGNSGTQFKYTPSTMSPHEYGRFKSSIIYPSGGYIVDLHRNKQNVSDLATMKTDLAKVKNAGYIDQGTRVIFVNTNFYNPNVGEHMVASFIVEFLPGGSTNPFVQLKTYRLYVYSLSARDVAKLVIEVIIIIFLIVFTAMEFSQLLSQNSKRWYFRPILYLLDDFPWNILDILTIFLFWYSYISLWAYAGADKSQIDLTSTGYINLEWYANTFQNFYNIAAFNILLTFVKANRYMQVFPPLSILTLTLGRAAGDLASYVVLFLLVFVAFSSFGLVTFGPEMLEFKDFQSSLSTAFRMVLGDFDYVALIHRNRILGPVYFFLFAIIVYFILSNMFVALILNSYDRVMEENKKKNQIKKILNKYKHAGKGDSNSTKYKISKLMTAIGRAFLEAKLRLRLFRHKGGLVVPDADHEDEYIRSFLNWTKTSDSSNVEGLSAESLLNQTKDVCDAIHVVPEYANVLLATMNSILKENQLREALENASDDEDIDVVMASAMGIDEDAVRSGIATPMTPLGVGTSSVRRNQGFGSGKMTALSRMRSAGALGLASSAFMSGARKDDGGVGVGGEGGDGSGVEAADRVSRDEFMQLKAQMDRIEQLIVKSAQTADQIQRHQQAHQAPPPMPKPQPQPKPAKAGPTLPAGPPPDLP